MVVNPYISVVSASISFDLHKVLTSFSITNNRFDLLKMHSSFAYSP